MNAEVALSEVDHQIFVFDEEATRGDIIYHMNQYIPQNEFGLPIFFLRSDLLHGGHLTQDEVDAASVGLFYYEGFPTLENGSSFWNQLPHEPFQRYVLFQAYLDQAADIGIRQLDLLSSEGKCTIEELSDISREFYWSARARAYDLFIVAAEAKKRQHRIRKMENSHFVETGKLFDKLLGRFAGENEDWIDELNAKEAVEVLEALVKIQRMSVGLTGQHASSTARDFGPADSSETMIRKLAQGAGVGGGGADKFAAQLQHLLENPEEGAILQAAVIKITAPANRQNFADEM